MIKIIEKSEKNILNIVDEKISNVLFGQNKKMDEKLQKYGFQHTGSN
jgi:hypothetical protein